MQRPCCESDESQRAVVISNCVYWKFSVLSTTIEVLPGIRCHFCKGYRCSDLRRRIIKILHERCSSSAPLLFISLSARVFVFLDFTRCDSILLWLLFLFLIHHRFVSLTNNLACTTPPLPSPLPFFSLALELLTWVKRPAEIKHNVRACLSSLRWVGKLTGIVCGSPPLAAVCGPWCLKCCAN